MMPESMYSFHKIRNILVAIAYFPKVVASRPLKKRKKKNHRKGNNSDILKDKI